MPQGRDAAAHAHAHDEVAHEGALEQGQGRRAAEAVGVALSRLRGAAV